MHTINIETLRIEAKRQLESLRQLLQKAQHKGLVEAPAKGPHSRATFDTESLPKVFEVLDGESYKLDHLDMVLAVVGTMKAGKSTSINAIIGAEVLPNRNRPMTTLPTLIRHAPGVIEPRLMFEKVQPINDRLAVLAKKIQQANRDTLRELDDAGMGPLLDQIRQQVFFEVKHDGEERIFGFLKSLNDVARLCAKLEVDFPFSEYATVDAMPVIEVEFSHLKDTPATQGRLTLLDTPGPNEAGQEHLRPMLKDQLKKASAVLAVFDYTQLKSDADEQVRENLIEISGTVKGRMYALVNKFDQKDRNGDDEASVKQLVSQTLMKGRISGNSVFPVSANQGFLASRARNEIARNGRLNIEESWVKDFAEEALGRRWEKYIEDPNEVKEAATQLWSDSGFAMPLEMVVVEAHRNAALEALRSAASKLDDIAKNAGDFFKANVGALKKDAAALQENIDNLQRDIESIARIEQSVKLALTKSLEDMRSNVKDSASEMRVRFSALLDAYFKEGKSIESENKKRKSPKASRKKKEPESIGNVLETLLPWFGSLGAARDDGQDFDPGATVIKFDSKSEADGFRERIELSIRNAISDAEEAIKDCAEAGVVSFHEELNRQRENALEKIKNSVQRNMEGFDIEIRLPDAKSIVLDTSVSSILKNAVEEKSRSVTRRRRTSGAWGTVCRWFNSDDWGWEEYRATEDYYEVDLEKIYKSASKGIDNLFASADTALEHDIYKQLNEGVDEFFGVFREKVEHIRGDLMSGIQKHSLDQARKEAILEESSQMSREASGLEKDCSALNDSAEALRNQEGVSAQREEALA